MCTQSSYVKVCVAKTQQLSALCGVSLFFLLLSLQKRACWPAGLQACSFSRVTRTKRIEFFRDFASFLASKTRQNKTSKEKKEEKNVCYARALGSSNLATVQRGGGDDDDC